MALVCVIVVCGWCKRQLCVRGLGGSCVRGLGGSYVRGLGNRCV